MVSTPHSSRPQPDTDLGFVLALPAWDTSRIFVLVEDRRVDSKFFCRTGACYWTLLVRLWGPTLVSMFATYRGPWPTGLPFNWTTVTLSPYNRPAMTLPLSRPSRTDCGTPLAGRLGSPRPVLRRNSFGSDECLGGCPMNVTGPAPCGLISLASFTPMWLPSESVRVALGSRTFVYGASPLVRLSLLLPLIFDLSNTAQGCFLDLRPILAGVEWGANPERYLNLNALARRFASRCPPGFRVSCHGGRPEPLPLHHFLRLNPGIPLRFSLNRFP